jgi:hypothetical protein
VTQRQVDLLIGGADAIPPAPATQTITFTGIPSAEAFGTMKTIVTIYMVGIASAEAFGNLNAQTGQQIVIPGIPSAEAFGTLQINETIHFNGIASAEAFGTLRVNETIYPNAIPSAEAFGSLRVNETIRFTGIPSAEAFGTLQLNETIYFTGIPSAGAFGTLRVNETIYPNAIPSAEAFGALQLNEKIYFTGIPSAEAFGTLAVIGGRAVVPSGIPSAEAFGTLRVNETIYPNAIASAEAFGNLHVTPLIKPTGIPSAEAFGHPQLNVTIHFTGIPSAETFGTLSVRKVITIPGIPSAEQFGTLTVLQPTVIHFTGIPSEEAFGTLVVQNFATLVNHGAFSGPIDGGTEVLLTGDVIDTSGCSDNFDAGIINLGFWTIIDSGSGFSSPVPEDSTIRFDSGTTPGSVSGLRTIGTMGTTDVQATFLPQLATLTGGAFETIASLALVVTPGVTEFQLSIEMNQTGVQLRMRALINGTTTVNQTAPIRTPGPGVPSTLVPRIVRFGSRVIGILNGTKFCDFPWVMTLANAEVSVRNDPVIASQVTTKISVYQRSPQIVFGTEPAIDFVLFSPTAGTAVVRTPAVPKPQVVSIGATGCSHPESVPMGFTYVIGDRFILEQDATRTLTVLNDPALKES